MMAPCKLAYFLKMIEIRGMINMRDYQVRGFNARFALVIILLCFTARKH